MAAIVPSELQTAGCLQVALIQPAIAGAAFAGCLLFGCGLSGEWETGSRTPLCDVSHGNAPHPIIGHASTAARHHRWFSGVRTEYVCLRFHNVAVHVQFRLFAVAVFDGLKDRLMLRDICLHSSPKITGADCVDPFI